MSKTAEEHYKEAIGGFSVGKPSEHVKKYILKAMHTYAHQQALEFSEWAARLCWKWDMQDEIWYVPTIVIPDDCTTEQLYQLFTQQNQK